MLWKCCTQYASKFGKLSCGHRTGKAQFSFQSLGKAMPKNAQTITQLHSSHMLEKEMATHSSTLAWKIPWTEEPCRLQSMGSQRIGHDWTTSLTLSILWHCLSLGLEWKLNFLHHMATAEFSKNAGLLSAALSQHHLLGFEIAQLEFHHLH